MCVKGHPDLRDGGRALPGTAPLLLLILGAIVNPNFIGIDNLLNVTTRSAFIAIIAIGATFVISAGDLDLSVGSMVAFVASLMILFMNSRRHRRSRADAGRAMSFAIVVGRRLRSCQRSDHHGRQDRTVHRHARHHGHLSRSYDMAVAGRRDHADGIRTLQELYRPAYFGSILGIPVPIVIILRHSAWRPSSSTARAMAGMSWLSDRTSDVARYSGIPVNRVRTIDLRHPGPVRGDRRVCSTCRGSDRPRQRRASCGNCRRSPPSSSAARRCAVARPRLGHDLRRLHPRTRRQHHAAFQFHQRISDRRHPGRDHHRCDARSALAGTEIVKWPGSVGSPGHKDCKTRIH